MDHKYRVRQRAYEIWEREGRPEGQHETHWHQAMNDIMAEDGGMPNEPDGNEPLGPEAGLRTPPSAIERGLHEAADALRGAGGGGRTDADAAVSADDSQGSTAKAASKSVSTL